jgi:hypothetical protein
MGRLSQHEQARILPKNDEALSLLHVPFQPGNIWESMMEPPQISLTTNIN